MRVRWRLGCGVTNFEGLESRALCDLPGAIVWGAAEVGAEAGFGARVTLSLPPLPPTDLSLVGTKDGTDDGKDEPDGDAVATRDAAIGAGDAVVNDGVVGVFDGAAEAADGIAEVEAVGEADGVRVGLMVLLGSRDGIVEPDGAADGVT
jgi:hypothetical protein